MLQTPDALHNPLPFSPSPFSLPSCFSPTEKLSVQCGAKSCSPEIKISCSLGKVRSTRLSPLSYAFIFYEVKVVWSSRIGRVWSIVLHFQPITTSHWNVCLVTFLWLLTYDGCPHINNYEKALLILLFLTGNLHSDNLCASEIVTSVDSLSLPGSICLNPGMWNLWRWAKTKGLDNHAI